MNSFLIAIQLALFLGVVSAIPSREDIPKECEDPLVAAIAPQCPKKPRKVSPLEQASQNVTCEDIKAWFKSSDKESNNKKWTLHANGFEVTLGGRPRINTSVDQKTILGKVKEPLSLPSDWFKGMVEQFNAKWNGKHYTVDCKSYPGLSVYINDEVKLTYSYDLLTNYYETEEKECILKVADNKSADEFILGLPSKCLTVFNEKEFPQSSSNSEGDKEINVPAKGWSNNKPSPSKQGNKKGERFQNKRH